MSKIIIIFYLIFFLIFPFTAKADTVDNQSSGEVFEAEVIKIIEEKTITREDGTKSLQQNLLLRGLEKEWRGKDVEYKGVSDLDVANASVYKIGDKVLVDHAKNIDGQDEYFVLDFVRSGSLLLLGLVFLIVVLIIGRIKGLKAVISLIVSFFIIIKFIVPRLLAGDNPLVIGIIGALAILAVIIYLTEGWNKKSHLAVFSVLVSLIITFLLSWFFIYLTKLTGMDQEEAMLLIGSKGGNIDFRGLLLAGILIGTVGVLDDIIIGQIEAVDQIVKANSRLSAMQVFKSAYQIGNAHLGAIINTLFLTYAGVSLPLLILFYINPAGSVSFSQVINNEVIATEIVRTLVGSIGVALSMPISTGLAVWWLRRK